MPKGKMTTAGKHIDDLAALVKINPIMGVALMADAYFELNTLVVAALISLELDDSDTREILDIVKSAELSTLKIDLLKRLANWIDRVTEPIKEEVQAKLKKQLN